MENGTGNVLYSLKHFKIWVVSTFFAGSVYIGYRESF